MQYSGYFGELGKTLKSIPLELLIEISILSIFIPALIAMDKYNDQLFHSLSELFNCAIFFAIFVFAYNTYNISKNNFLMLLGIGCFFVALVNVVQIFPHTGVSILFEERNKDIETEAWIIARYIWVFTCLASTIFIFKPEKNLNVYLVFIAYFFITALSLLSIFYLNIFPNSYIGDKGLASFKLISEYIISFLYIIVAIIYYRLRKNIEFQLFAYIEGSLVILVVSEFLLAVFFNPLDWRNGTGYILKVISAYFIYKAIIEIGLKKPYSTVFNDLNLIGHKVKESQKMIVSNQQCYDMIINNSDNAIVIGSENKLVFANNKLAELVGVENVADIMNSEIERFIPDEVKVSALHYINETIRNKKITPFKEARLKRLDGQVIDMEIMSCFCSYYGKPSIVAMFRDIRERKQIKQLENDIVENKKEIDKTREMNKLMTEFFANISHELKTPLNVILSAIQILSLPSGEETNNSAELRLNKYIKSMRQNCYRLLRIVNNLIDITKFDAGYLQLNLKNYNIVDIVEDITMSVADYIESKGIELIFDTDVEEKIMAIDADKIERIILNLLSNSIKFTNKGGKILVNLLNKNKSIIISVRDTGIGIPEDKLDIIFERFGQVDRTLSRNREGSGIGLSLVKSIVDMHRGSIRVLSKLGKGSEFIIELPVKLVKEKIYDKCLYENKLEKVRVEFSDIYL
ncbi:PAS domain S-box protein [Clostridium sp. PL3]|uniref:histidine kinase n=1 Tax=Clostridium thailandense TaxID=2794346 RepID=A0A949WSQ4_9CLOT|nr:MASE3 domain-containing protein [Clostridium thailandense]MBV7275346.1 PAS domain S-box protein [Clostridium thailandense]